MYFLNHDRMNEKRVLIINLTRMGDLIQTIGLINQIHKNYLNCKIDMLVMKSFSPIIKHFYYISEVFTFDEDIFSYNISNDVWDSYNKLNALLEELDKRSYEAIYNPIISEQSSLLMYLIKGKNKYGMQFTQNRQQKMTCDFSSYLLANQHSLGDFSYNLVDIFAGMVNGSQPSGLHATSYMNNEKAFIDRDTTCIGVSFNDFKLKVLPEDLDTIRLFSTKVKSFMKPILGFHIGASQSNKAWTIKNYHIVIEELLLKKDYCIILFGGYKEKEFKHHFSNIQSELFFNTIGDFKLNELVAAIDIINLLITNDTGPMHVATALQKPVIDISLGPVSKWESGPYNSSALIIEANLDCHPCSFTFECSHWNCHTYITPDIVVNAIEHMITKNMKYDNIVPLLFDEKVRFFNVKKDCFNFLSFIPFFNEELTAQEYIFLLKRFIWSLFFTNKLHTDIHILKDMFDEFKFDYKTTNYDFRYIKKNVCEIIDIIKLIINDLDLVLNQLSQLTDTFESKHHFLDHENISDGDSNHVNQNEQQSDKSISDKNLLDKNRVKLICVQNNKEAMLDRAKSINLIYDWFWFFIFKESEIEDFDLKTIIEKTIRLYETLYRKIIIFNDLL